MSERNTGAERRTAQTLRAEGHRLIAAGHAKLAEAETLDDPATSGDEWILLPTGARLTGYGLRSATVTAAAKRGELTIGRIGRTPAVRRAELDRWIETRGGRARPSLAAATNDNAENDAGIEEATEGASKERDAWLGLDVTDMAERRKKLRRELLARDPKMGRQERQQFIDEMEKEIVRPLVKRKRLEEKTMRDAKKEPKRAGRA